jgi:hypothetical protein
MTAKPAKAISFPSKMSTNCNPLKESRFSTAKIEFKPAKQLSTLPTEAFI